MLDGLSDPCAQFLQTIKVTECSGQGVEIESGAYRLENVEMDVQAYQLRGVEMDNSQPVDISTEKLEDDTPQARIIPLPNKELDGVWES